MYGRKGRGAWRGACKAGGMNGGGMCGRGHSCGCDRRDGH